MPERFRFLIDETSLTSASDATPVALNGVFDMLADHIESLRAHTVGKLSDIWNQTIGEHSLADWLFDPSLGLERVAATALSVALDRTPDWDKSWDSSELATAVMIDGVSQEAASVSAAVREMREKRATACISASPSRAGRLPVDDAEGSVDLHFTTSAFDALSFFRELPEIENFDEDAYFENARFAFPNLRFVRERTRFKYFDESYDTVRAKVTAHLAILNDEAQTILKTKDHADVKVGRFGSLGISASGESSQTKADKSAMRQREVTVDGSTVICDWHTKIRPHIDRIYFNGTSSDRVVVGVFRDHLD